MRVRYDTELSPLISAVRCPGRPVILGMEPLQSLAEFFCANFGAVKTFREVSAGEKFLSGRREA